MHLTVSFLPGTFTAADSYSIRQACQMSTIRTRSNDRDVAPMVANKGGAKAAFQHKFIIPLFYAFTRQGACFARY